VIRLSSLRRRSDIMSRWRSNCRSCCSCDSPASFLSRRKTFPKAIAGSKKFSQYTGRDVRLTLSFGFHNILVIVTFVVAVAVAATVAAALPDIRAWLAILPLHSPHVAEQH
jgi:hypothetical protein